MPAPPDYVMLSSHSASTSNTCQAFHPSARTSRICHAFHRTMPAPQERVLVCHPTVPAPLEHAKLSSHRANTSRTCHAFHPIVPALQEHIMVCLPTVFHHPIVLSRPEHTMMSSQYQHLYNMLCFVNPQCQQPRS